MVLQDVWYLEKLTHVSIVAGERGVADNIKISLEFCIYLV